MSDELDKALGQLGKNIEDAADKRSAFSYFDFEGRTTIERGTLNITLRKAGDEHYARAEVTADGTITALSIFDINEKPVDEPSTQAQYKNALEKIIAEGVLDRELEKI